MILKYVLWCYLFMTIYMGISVIVRSQFTKYHLFLWIIAPVSTPYHILFLLSRLLTNMDDE